jgi:hypothetical protein
MAEEKKGEETKPSKYAPREQTEREERDADAFREQAKRWIYENRRKFPVTLETSPGDAICVMFYRWSGGELRQCFGHSSAAWKEKDGKTILANMRKEHSVKPEKKKRCAEEHVILHYPGFKFLFSITYHRELGVIYACSEGCRSMLAARHIARHIEDLAKYFHGKKWG